MASDNFNDPPPGNTPLPFVIIDNIDNVFRAGERQTPIKRSPRRPNLGGIFDPIWLCTNYKPELQERYERLVTDVDIGRDHILDEPELYDFVNNRDGIIAGILSRVPPICNTFTGSVPEDYDFVAISEDGTPLGGLWGSPKPPLGRENMRGAPARSGVRRFPVDRSPLPSLCMQKQTGLQKYEVSFLPVARPFAPHLPTIADDHLSQSTHVIYQCM